MRSGMARSGMIRMLISGGFNRHSHENRGSRAWCRFDLESSANERSAFAHAEQPESLSLSVSVWRKSLSIIFNHEQDVATTTLEDDFDITGVRVLRDIGECFLRDAVQSRF